MAVNGSKHTNIGKIMLLSFTR